MAQAGRIIFLTKIVFLIFLSQAFAQFQTPGPFMHLPPYIPEIVDTIPNTYYISSSGSDTNDGLDSATAFRTISRLQSLTLVPGDTVRFRGGDTISGYLEYSQSSYYFSGSTLPFTFNSYGSGKAVLEIEESKARIIRFYWTFRLTFRNLIFIGKYNPLTFTGGRNDESYGLDLSFNYNYNNDSNLLIVDSCEFYNFRTSGLAFGNVHLSQRGRYLIEGNVFKNMGAMGFNVYWINYSNFVIRNNSITDIVGRDSIPEKGYCASGIELFFCKNVLIERNYINNVGYVFGTATGGIYLSDARNCMIRYNEVKNVRNKRVEGGGIYWDCGSDSMVAEYNYVANCHFGISIAGSATSYPCYILSGMFEDSLASSFNVVRYNIVIGDSGSQNGMGIYMYYSYNPNYVKRCFVYNNLIFMKRSKTHNWNATFKDSNGYNCIGSTGKADSVYFYNNIFICGDSTTAFNHSFTRSAPPASNFYRNWFTNAQIHNNIYYSLAGTTNKMFWEAYGEDTLPGNPWLYRKYSSIQNWADSTGQEKSGVSYTYITADPQIKRLTQNLSAKINPHMLDTLTCFQFNTGSPADGSGVNYNSEVFKVADTATVDWYGTIIPFSSPDIGIYVKP